MRATYCSSTKEKIISWPFVDLYIVSAILTIFINAFFRIPKNSIPLESNGRLESNQLKLDLLIYFPTALNFISLRVGPAIRMITYTVVIIKIKKK